MANDPSDPGDAEPAVPGRAAADAGDAGDAPGPADAGAGDDDLAALGYVPPDPEEPQPLDLWAAVGAGRPWCTLLVLFSWAWMFLLAARGGAFDGPAGLFAWGANATNVPWSETAWRLLASTFLHGGPEHIFFNAISLVVVAPAVERIFTRWRFCIIYAVGAATASYASLAWRVAHHGDEYSVGGSGAIFALGGALLVAAIRLRGRLAPTRARALGAALLYLIAPGFAAGFAQPRTDSVAHAAGLACGVLLGAVLPLDPRLGGRRPSAPTRLLSALCVLALAASLAMAVVSGMRG